eukprot:3823185-Rhodomonas_salina.1
MIRGRALFRLGKRSQRVSHPKTAAYFCCAPAHDLQCIFCLRQPAARNGGRKMSASGTKQACAHCEMHRTGCPYLRRHFLPGGLNGYPPLLLSAGKLSSTHGHIQHQTLILLRSRFRCLYAYVSAVGRREQLRRCHFRRVCARRTGVGSTSSSTIDCGQGLRDHANRTPCF